METRADTKVHLSVTLPATALGVPTRPQAVDPHQGSLLLLHGLNSNQMNAEKLFNLLCLYGNVVKITFRKNRNGCVMVQMEGHLAKQRALQQRRPASGLSHEKTTEAAVLPKLDEAFTMRELKSALQECSQHTSPGPDGVIYKALANLGPLALGALLQQYNVSWNTGQLPESWKKSRLVPILKAGKSPLSLESYCPIALSSCIGKLMERMILNRLLWYLEKTGVFPECMSGFRRGRSAIDGVVDLVSDVEQHRSRRLSTVAVFLDIKAAFDSVEHSAILTSLIKLRVRGRIYNWILDYLQGRTIYLTTTEGNSDCFSVTAGVPQGGVLSPTLFNVVLAHLPQELSEHVKMSMYADDLCIWSSGPNRAVICGRLQRALSRIERYLICRGLHLSPSKCVAMAFTR
ncbi:hypothetical protein ISCGN_026789 [Ixodes scapularis]